jgi:hypothetical protein
MDSLDAIRHQINAGDPEGAKRALRTLLEAEPDNAAGWALLAILLPDPAEKAECYRQILRVNPTDRHAAAWLDALQPDARRPSMGSVPVGKLPGDGPDTESPVVKATLDDLLDAVDLPGSDSTGAQPAEQEIDRNLGGDVARWSERQPGRPGFLERLMGRRQRGRPEPGSVVSSLDDDAAVQPGSMNPSDILRMAGGPLPPEERRKCQDCGAVVSRRDARCPWCSASLRDAG